VRDQLPGISLAQPPDFRLFDSLRRSAINTAFVISIDNSAGTSIARPSNATYPICVLACLIWKAPSEAADASITIPVKTGSWTQYCREKLHRSDRRIRQILAENNPASEKHRRKSLPATKDPKALSQPKTVKMPKIQVSEWTPESVADALFSIVSAVFQEPQLSDEDRKRAVELSSTG
jgi:hypothetical protein